MTILFHDYNVSEIKTGKNGHLSIRTCLRIMGKWEVKSLFTISKYTIQAHMCLPVRRFVSSV